MRIKIAAQNILEWMAFKANLVPVPLIHAQVFPLLAKAVLDAHTLGVFECIGKEQKSINEIASNTRLDAGALSGLLNVLIAAGYLKYRNNQFSLTRMSRKWCLKDSPLGLFDQQAFNQVSWNFLDQLQGFLRTGKGLQYHDTFNEEEWELYQKGMMNIASIAAGSIMKLAPELNNPLRMLDVGGSHGLFSLEYIKKHPTIKATIIDLPAAVAKAEPLLRNIYKGDHIEYRAGNALTDNLGSAEYDIVLMASLMHHFSKEQNYMVSKKIFAATKTGGYFIIHEFLRPPTSGKMELTRSVMDLFFSLSSTSGSFGPEEYIDFQRSAGFKNIRIKKFITIPGMVQIIGQKL